MSDIPVRKPPRLGGYDYSENGCYFVTICTKDRKCLLGRVGRDDLGAPQEQTVFLSPFGEIAERYLLSIPEHYSGVVLDHYIIMPNHVHLLITLDNGAPGSSRPTISQIIAAWKRFVNQSCGRNLWQASFYDHIIRNEADYLTHWNYIDGNAQKWETDPFYIQSTDKERETI